MCVGGGEVGEVVQFTLSFCRYADHYTLSDLCKAPTVSLVLADPGGCTV